MTLMPHSQSLSALISQKSENPTIRGSSLLTLTLFLTLSLGGPLGMLCPLSKAPSWGGLGSYKGDPRWGPVLLTTMDPHPLTWALVLLGPALALSRAPAPAQEAPEKLCGHHFVRALVRLCGGPRWSPEDGRAVAGGDREWGQMRTVLWALRVGSGAGGRAQVGVGGRRAGLPACSQVHITCLAGNQCE